MWLCPSQLMKLLWSLPILMQNQPGCGNAASGKKQLGVKRLNRTNEQLLYTSSKQASPQTLKSDRTWSTCVTIQILTFCLCNYQFDVVHVQGYTTYHVFSTSTLPVLIGPEDSCYETFPPEYLLSVKATPERVFCAPSILCSYWKHPPYPPPPSLAHPHTQNAFHT